ncbi:PREDICTED: ecdysteroid-regulated 16 kDa protein-like [Papilio xuthus]|uniref:Ecdysteroid-regulated 16 kDa protein n=1 Tax=Papilio xuthus TaxID=66420 RepID=I4DJK0_PAPXU|nr:ecdysteroid-regulated 16 kDa protein-like precursor [Papilio xuthus]KPI90959.1 Ecdysteroid-regulated 16 kDa protein [Papilio xuthus]BAM18090.1 niemann-pick type C-2a [Papilio xuthus]
MLFYVTVAVLLASVQAKFYSDCGSNLSTLQKVEVSGCSDNAKECILKRNTNVTISLEFTPSKDIKNLETEVHGVIMNLPVPFPLPQPDACKDTGLRCPLKAGDVANYKSTLPVLKSYPKVKVDVKWELKFDEEDVVCILIPAKIN